MGTSWISGQTSDGHVTNQLSLFNLGLKTERERRRRASGRRKAEKPEQLSLDLGSKGVDEAETSKIVAKELELSKGVKLVSKVPQVFKIGEFTAEKWLSWLVAAKQFMLFVHGQNKHICRVSSEASWEQSIKGCVDRVWLMRGHVEAVLRGNNYVYRGIVRDSSGAYARVFVNFDFCK